MAIMKFPYSVQIFSEKETAELAKVFSDSIFSGDIIVLCGELGSGKTFFVKEVARQFGINNVSSPTFSLINEYIGRVRIYHFDFYRIEKSNELFDIGFNDYLNDDDSIIFIEWGNMFPEIIPGNRIEINIEVKKNLSRRFIINKYE
ncbi:MAG TPA: tRNA (adenosine(37)-N6)-threonylcarbamoyltransferase complex ATPase subunit type 1 TsaE [Ignavibacteriaceae bacterium]|nr:tRNA (adenosine(37)-N6)-threonylcarbamoyltransferase complex ATPase subunit type 1 TsaE [Ignavibacteriaceae bacterium]